MTANVGRTVSRYVNFIVTDSGNALRNIPVDSVNGVGLKYDEADVTAFQDAIKNVLTGLPDMSIEISGPFDTKAADTTPALSGSHTVLAAIVGDNLAHSLDVQIGVRHAWESGEPQFGITRASATNSGVTCTSYTVDLSAMKYSATFKVIGSVAPAWGTAAETAGS